MNTHPCNVPDFETEAFIAALSLLDIQDIERSRKRKFREGTPLTDEEIAFNIQAENFKSFAATLQDRQFALSLDGALDTDTAALASLSMINQGEHDDHLAALALERGDNLPSPTRFQRILEYIAVPPESGSTTTSNSHITSAVEPDSDDSDDDEPSHLYKDCIICGDRTRYGHTFRAPCSHWYCRGCLVQLVEASTRDEKLHPLRCCHQNLPDVDVFPLLPMNLRTRFRLKSVEFATPPSSRLYCPNPTCSAFLGSSSSARRGAVVTCTHCATRACTACRNHAHPNKNCTENVQTLAVKSLASQMGWQTCPGCRAIVELQQGCYHMTCRCSTQFCYLCAALWKNCSCRQWDEDRLEDDAERRVVNEFGAQEAAARPAVFAQRVLERMEDLEDNHECDEHVWQYRRGEGCCEECGDFLPTFLLLCVGCQMLVCKRCSVNRL